jgi:hypothetical protein
MAWSFALFVLAAVSLSAAALIASDAALAAGMPGTDPARIDLAGIGGRFVELASVPLSRFRDGVEYARAGATSIFSDEMLLYTVAAALFVVTLFLIAVQKMLYKAKHNG